jgi:hypothetical protein
MARMSRLDRYIVTHPRFAKAFLRLYHFIPRPIRKWIEDHREPLEEITITPVAPTTLPEKQSRIALPRTSKLDWKEPTWYAEAKRKGAAERIKAAKDKRSRKGISHSRTHPNG